MTLIRAPELKDIPSLKNLFLQLGYQTNTDRLRQQINQEHKNITILVAESENELCGVIVVNFITPVHENGLWALISALVIDESSRGAGIGRGASARTGIFRTAGCRNTTLLTEYVQRTGKRYTWFHAPESWLSGQLGYSGGAATEYGTDRRGG